MPPDPRALIHPKTLGQFRMRPLEEGRDWIVDGQTGCWEWHGFKLKRYARCTAGQAHREVWRQSGRELADGDHLHHKCRNPGCVNPDHMEPKAPRLHIKDHKQEDSHLSWDDVREIRRIACEGDTPIYELGERYGLGKSQVFNIVANLKWHDPAYTPGRPAVCVLEECAAAFLARRSNQRFCCTAHRRLWNSRRTNRRARGVPLDGPSKWWKGDRDAA